MKSFFTCTGNVYYCLYHNFHRSWEVSGGNSLCALERKCVGLGNVQIEVVRLKPKKARVMKTFTGHTCKVSHLVHLRSHDGSVKYMLSASQDDRFVYAW